MTFTIVAAQPGWSVLHPEMYAGNEEKFDPDMLEPIIAWRIETNDVRNQDRRFDVAVAITADGTAPDSAFIVAPTGVATDRVDHYFASVADALKHIRGPSYRP